MVAGAAHDAVRSAGASPDEVSFTFLGAVGVPYGVFVVPDDHSDAPMSLMARTVNVYAVPFVSPPMRWVMPAAPAP